MANRSRAALTPGNRLLSANNVTMWPDLVAGQIEIRRVLRPDGRLVLSWHSVTAPGRTERRFALPDSDLDQVTKALEGTFGNAHRRGGKYSVIWEALGRFRIGNQHTGHGPEEGH